MRFDELHTHRYGPSPNRQLNLRAPAGGGDLHIIYGPNEAGKSTARQAVSDFLFGIPRLAAARFGSDYADMQIMANIETADGSKMGLIRSKKSKGSLANAAGEQIDESILGKQLAGLSRDAYQDLFSMDLRALQDGARDMIEGRGDAGESLFSALAGMTGLNAARKQLADAAAEVYQLRAKNTRFAKAVKSLTEAREAARGVTIRAAEYKAASDRARTAADELEAAKTASQQLDSESRRIQLRQLLRSPLGILSAAADELAQVEHEVLLPPDAQATLQGARREMAVADSSRTAAESDLKSAMDQLATLPSALPAIERADEIESLRDQRSAASGVPEQLRKLVSQRDGLKAEISALSEDLGLCDQDRGKAPSLPTATTRASIQRLVREHSTVAARLAERATLQQRAIRKADELAAAKANLPTASVASKLASALGAAKSALPAVAGRTLALDEQRLAEARLAVLIEGLAPFTGGLPGLRAMNPQGEIFANEIRAGAARLAQEMRAIDERIAEARDEAGGLRALIDGLTASGVVTRGQIVAAREARDAAITEALKQHATAAEILGLVAAVDQQEDAAILSVAKAENIAVSERSLEVIDGKRKSLEADHAARATDLERLQLEWTGAMASLGVPGLRTDNYAAWLQKRHEALAVVDKFDAAGCEVRQLTSTIDRAASRLAEEMARLGAPTASKDLESLIVAAEEIIATQEGDAKAREVAEAAHSDATEAAAACRADLEDAEQAMGAWRAEWASVVNGLSVPDRLNPDDAAAWVTTAENLRAAATMLKSIVERDIPEAEGQVQVLLDRARELAHDLGISSEGDATAITSRLLEELTRQRAQADQRRQADAAVSRAQALLDRAASAHRNAMGNVQPLLDQARCTLSEIDDRIERSGRRAKAERDHEHAKAEAARAAPSADIAAAFAEVAVATHEQDANRLAAIEGGLRDAVASALDAATRNETEARLQLQTWDGRADAAEANGRVAEAEEEVRAAIIAFAALSARERLLRAGIDTFREAHEGPMLSRTAELLARLTKGSSAGLEIDPGDGAPTLLVRRRSGAVATVNQLSEGQADQLYLSLRLAAVGLRLDTGPTLPFIADDLLMTSDSERAQEAIRALHQLSHRTQVLYFTHHEHIVDLAIRAVGSENVNIINLSAAA